MIRNVLMIVAAGLLAGCSDKKEVDKQPKIMFTSLSANEVKQGSSEEYVRVHFNITDGDADILVDGSTESVYLIDSRDESKEEKGYALPEVPNGLIDPAYGFEGSAFVEVPAAFLLLRTDDSLRVRDTLTYEIFIKDAAGNQSNREKSDPIYINK